MTDDGRTETAAEELALASEELQVAAGLIDAGHARVALARAYFAAFHAVRAVLYAEGLEPKSHAGVHTLWNNHLVRSGRFPPSTSRLLARLQKFREEADYSRSFVVDDAGAREELAAAAALVADVRSRLASDR